MKYYIIRQSSDPKITGIANGGSQAKIDKSEFANKDYYEKFTGYFLNNDPSIFWKNLGTIPDFDFELQCVRLELGAKATDFLSYYPSLYHGGNFLVNAQLLSLLSKFNLPTYRTYKTQTYSNVGQLLDYDLLYCPPLDYDVIDFEKTLFFTGNRLRGKRMFSIKSGTEFQKMKDEQIFQTEKIVLNSSFDASLDFFSLKVSVPNLFISERLKNALIDQKISGVNIVEASEPSIELTI